MSLKKNPHSPKKSYQPQKLINAVAQATIETKGIGLAKHGLLKDVSRDDRLMLQRVVGMSVEEFNQRLMGKLDCLADKILDRMLDTVDETPLNNLGFNLSVAMDKRQRMAGAAAVGNANVNIQVNNYGSMSKEEILAKLTGKMATADVSQPAPATVEAEVVTPAVSKPTRQQMMADALKGDEPA
jgi:hypothetical protein